MGRAFDFIYVGERNICKVDVVQGMRWISRHGEKWIVVLFETVSVTPKS